MVSQKKLKESLHYNKETGLFTWLVDRGGNKVKGVVAGCKTKTGRGKAYVTIGLERYGYKAHRLAFLWMTGSTPDQVDHIDGNGLNNKWCNIRESNPLLNAKNHKMATNNTSGVTGVVWDRKICKWQAQIGVKEDGKRKTKFLGAFKSKIDAVISRKMAEYHYNFSFSHGLNRPSYKG